MKKWFSLNNIIIFFLLGFLIYSQVPRLINNFRKGGTKFASQKFEVIFPKMGPNFVIFPPEKSKAIAIFWATWCGPCKVEMGRLRSSVESGKMPRSAIFAINPFEDRAVINEFLSKNNFPFTFIHAPEIAFKLNISATPTTLFIEDGVVTSISSGMSLFGIWRAEFFL